jgi:hypothetical protein
MLKTSIKESKGSPTVFVCLKIQMNSILCFVSSNPLIINFLFFLLLLPSQSYIQFISCEYESKIRFEALNRQRKDIERGIEERK